MFNSYIFFLYWKRVLLSEKTHLSGIHCIPKDLKSNGDFLKRSINFMECISKVDITVFTITLIYRKVPNKKRQTLNVYFSLFLFKRLIENSRRLFISAPDVTVMPLKYTFRKNLLKNHLRNVNYIVFFLTNKENDRHIMLIHLIDVNHIIT